jgi:hypothetical protein
MILKHLMRINDLGLVYLSYPPLLAAILFCVRQGEKHAV